MRYIDPSVNPELPDTEMIPAIDNIKDDKKKVKAHVIRRNVEDYLERKALERSLKEVFEDDFLLD